ncbi:unnamed protein product, partial [Symbiodinium sp. KB8]
AGARERMLPRRAPHEESRARRPQKDGWCRCPRPASRSPLRGQILGFRPADRSKLFAEGGFSTMCHAMPSSSRTPAHQSGR